MSVRIVDKDLNVVRRSRNLRAILEHARNRLVERIDLYRNSTGHGGQLGITWQDGSSVITDFACFTVMQDWVKARVWFKGIEPKVHG